MLKFLLIALLASAVAARSVEFNVPEDIPEETNEEKFVRSDTNHDDKLTFDEFLHTELVYELMKKDEFDQYDVDQDGLVTRKEYEGRLKHLEEKNLERKAKYFGKLFEDFDENFDMKLSEKEVRRIFADRFLLKPRQNFSKLFAIFDTNGDGALDIDEYVKFDEEFPFEELDPITVVTEIPVKTQKKEKIPMMKKAVNAIKF